MHTAPFLPLSALFFSLATAAPRPPSYGNPTNFYLVTTTSWQSASNSSTLPHVSATSVFDPNDQPTFLLRLIGPGYDALPTFNLSSAGTLQTLEDAPFTFKPTVYNSTEVQAGDDLSFAAAPESTGNLGLEYGYLLSVAGETKGWTICPGPIGEEVISWKGTGSSCTATYMQAVSKPPY